MGHRLNGILNGNDPTLWNPETDPEITDHFSREDLSGKRRCKAALQRAYGLPVEPHTPLFGMSARMVAQKGLDLVLGADLLASSNAQFIFLGAGEHRYHEALGNLAAAAPDHMAVEFMFTDHLEHRLLAGADALLMPSLYEPCGLTQMRWPRGRPCRRPFWPADRERDGVRPRAPQSSPVRPESRPLAARQRLVVRGRAGHVSPAAGAPRGVVRRGDGCAADDRVHAGAGESAGEPHLRARDGGFLRAAPRRLRRGPRVARDDRRPGAAAARGLLAVAAHAPTDTVR